MKLAGTPNHPVLSKLQTDQLYPLEVSRDVPESGSHMIRIVEPWKSCGRLVPTR